ncbi:MAG: RdgB/HAM1 family non-canonical purine NTP pyrophosphatase [Simkaniaceae bacterium]|nr:RdgB/HAM1 family non-canonical purine NTP pyrophosphatase [Simkaniaceae bacterium]
MTNPMTRLLIATTNLHKVREIRAVLRAHFPSDILTLHDFPDYRVPEERGKTFEENAALKALSAASALKEWVLADDSGLVVPALGGAPGIRSARYAGEGAGDQENRVKLLEELEKIDESERKGYYVCAMALASPEGIRAEVRGCCFGTLITTPGGGGGFGYDPLFRKYGYGKTFAEMGEEIKNRVSHRRKALDKLLSAIGRLRKRALL